MLWAFLLFFLSGQFDTTFRDGLIALNRNQLAEAEAKLEAAAQLQPSDARVWLALAQTYRRLDRAADSQKAAEHAESLAAGDGVVLHALGLFYTQSGDEARAAKAMQSAIAARPYEESYYFELAQLQLKHENFAAALETIGAGRKNFDRSAQLALAEGVACYGLRRFPQAIDAFLKTIDLDPSIEQPYEFLGRMLDQAEGRLPRIAAAFAAYAKRAPEDYRAAFLLGKSMSLANDPAAESTLRRSIALRGDYWESHFELGVLLARDRKYEDAAREVRRAVELNPSDPAPHYHLARLYDRLGKPAEAAAERAAHARLTAAADAAAHGMEAAVK